MPKRDAAGRSLSLTSQESYSAVIIADMVAEVRTDPPDENGRPPPERTNPAFEPSSPAVVDVEMQVHGQSKRNGSTTGIHQGVILNAAQFGHSDILVPDPLKMDGAHRNGAKVPDAATVDLKNMSVPRKIAFGLSFLPSVMFVLCFAVILPCKEPVPCIREEWSRTLKDTVLTSDLVSSSGKVFFTSFASSDESSVSGVEPSSGDVAWTASLKSPARFLHCAHLESRDSESCLVVEDTGHLYLFNASNGHVQWDKDNFGPSFPAVLPDCDMDGVAEVALGTSKGQVKILTNGAILHTVNVTDCESVPSALTPWQRGNETDLLFTCRHGKEERLMKLPQSQWCLSNRKPGRTKEKGLTLESRDVLSGSLLLPTEDGLVLWVEDDVIMFEPDGQRRWTASSSSHSEDNRFLLYGKFNATDMQVALFSSGLRSSLMVSALSSENGEIAWSKAESNSEISDVSLIHGKEKDFALVSMRKIMAQSSLASEALETMDAISSTILSVLAKEDVPSNDTSAPSKMATEIAFMEFGDRYILPIEQTEGSGGDLFRSLLTVLPNENEETLSIIVLRKPTGNSIDMTSQLRRIEVANWDISRSKESECRWAQ